jgi:hypothetical protein
VTRRTFQVRALALGAVVSAVVLGCQAIVGSDVPSFRCVGTSPSACPAGLTCDPVQGRCVKTVTAPVDADADAGEASIEEDAESPIEDAGKDAPVVDADAGPLPVGGGCRVDADCASRLCGDGTLLTASVVQTTGAVCTQTCCDSADCPNGSVCFGPGTGGKYCVRGTQLQRDVPTSGGSKGGGSCTKNTDCRSGLCDQNKCADTCCVDAECTGGAVCRFGVLQGHFTQKCENGAGLKADGLQCADNGECKSGACYNTSAPPALCRPACCGAKNCGGGKCATLILPPDTINVCVGGGGTGALGSSCAQDNDCKSDFCNPDDKTCAEVCCTDQDCTSFGNDYRCRPTSKPASNLQRQLHCRRGI